MQNVRFFADTATEGGDGDRRGSDPLDLSQCSFPSDMLSNRRFVDSGVVPIGSKLDNAGSKLDNACSGLPPAGLGLLPVDSGLHTAGSGIKSQKKQKVVLVPPRKWHRKYLDPQDVELRKSYFKSDRSEPTKRHKLDLNGFWTLPIALIDDPTSKNGRINENVDVSSGEADEAMDVGLTTQEPIESIDCTGSSFVSCMSRFYGRPGVREPPPLLLLPLDNGLLPPASSVERFNAAMQRLDDLSSLSVPNVELLREQLHGVRTFMLDRVMSLIHSKRTTWTKVFGVLETTNMCFNSCDARLLRAREDAVRADEERNRKRWEEIVKVVADVHGFGEEEKKAIGLQELVAEAVETMDRLSAEILVALREAEEEEERQLG